MDFLDFAQKTAKAVIQEAASRSNSSIGGKTVSQWDKEWVSIGPLKTANLTPYNHCVGLYRHVVKG